MYLATEGVEFGFNNIMYAQINGVLIGSPKTPQTSCILMLCGWHFFVFDSNEDAEAFHVQLNSLHPFHQFTKDVESDLALTFFGDVLVERKEELFITGVYQKPIFTGLYINLNSFIPQAPQDKPDF